MIYPICPTCEGFCSTVQTKQKQQPSTDRRIRSVRGSLHRGSRVEALDFIFSKIRLKEKGGSYSAVHGVHVLACGAEVACEAHNLEDPGSKPGMP